MTTLNVLIVDDSQTDAELIALALRRAGYASTWQRVDTPGTVLAALQSRITWDVITCDYSMPRLTAGTALDLVQSLAPTVPVVIVAGTLTEETASELKRRGAETVVTKQRLDALATVVRRLRRRRHERDS